MANGIDISANLVLDVLDAEKALQGISVDPIELPLAPINTGAIEKQLKGLSGEIKLDAIFDDSIFKKTAESLGAEIQSTLDSLTLDSDKGIFGSIASGIGSVLTLPLRLAGAGLTTVLQGAIGGIGFQLSQEISTGLSQGLQGELLGIGSFDVIGKSIGKNIAKAARDITGELLQDFNSSPLQPAVQGLTDRLQSALKQLEGEILLASKSASFVERQARSKQKQQATEQLAVEGQQELSVVPQVQKQLRQIRARIATVESGDLQKRIDKLNELQQQLKDSETRIAAVQDIGLNPEKIKAAIAELEQEQEELNTALEQALKPQDVGLIREIGKQSDSIQSIKSLLVGIQSGEIRNPQFQELIAQRNRLKSNVESLTKNIETSQNELVVLRNQYNEAFNRITNPLFIRQLQALGVQTGKQLQELVAKVQSLAKEEASGVSAQSSINPAISALSGQIESLQEKRNQSVRILSELLQSDDIARTVERIVEQVGQEQTVLNDALSASKSNANVPTALSNSIKRSSRLGNQVKRLEDAIIARREEFKKITAFVGVDPEAEIISKQLEREIIDLTKQRNSVSTELSRLLNSQFELSSELSGSEAGASQLSLNLLKQYTQISQSTQREIQELRTQSRAIFERIDAAISSGDKVETDRLKNIAKGLVDRITNLKQIDSAITDRIATISQSPSITQAQSNTAIYQEARQSINQLEQELVSSIGVENIDDAVVTQIKQLLSTVQASILEQRNLENLTNKLKSVDTTPAIDRAGFNTLTAQINEKLTFLVASLQKSSKEIGTTVSQVRESQLKNFLRVVNSFESDSQLQAERLNILIRESQKIARAYQELSKDQDLFSGDRENAESIAKAITARIEQYKQALETIKLGAGDRQTQSQSITTAALSYKAVLDQLNNVVNKTQSDTANNLQESANQVKQQVSDVVQKAFSRSGRNTGQVIEISPELTNALNDLIQKVSGASGVILDKIPEIVGIAGKNTSFAVEDDLIILSERLVKEAEKDFSEFGKLSTEFIFTLFHEARHIVQTTITKTANGLDEVNHRLRDFTIKADDAEIARQASFSESSVNSVLNQLEAQFKQELASLQSSGAAQDKIEQYTKDKAEQIRKALEQARLVEQDANVFAERLLARSLGIEGNDVLGNLDNLVAPSDIKAVDISSDVKQLLTRLQQELATLTRAQLKEVAQKLSIAVKSADRKNVLIDKVSNDIPAELIRATAPLSAQIQEQVRELGVFLSRATTQQIQEINARTRELVTSGLNSESTPQLGELAFELNASKNAVLIALSSEIEDSTRDYLKGLLLSIQKQQKAVENKITVLRFEEINQAIASTVNKTVAQTVSSVEQIDPELGDIGEILKKGVNSISESVNDIIRKILKNANRQVASTTTISSLEADIEGASTTTISSLEADIELESARKEIQSKRKNSIPNSVRNLNVAVSKVEEDIALRLAKIEIELNNATSSDSVLEMRAALPKTNDAIAKFEQAQIDIEKKIVKAQSPSGVFGQINKVANSVKDTANRFIDLNPIVGKSIGLFKGLGLAVAGYIAITTGFETLVEIGRQTQELTVRFENLTTSINFVSGGLEQGAKNFNAIAKSARDLKVALIPAIEGYTLLAAATQGTNLEKDTIGISKAILQAGRAYSITTDRLNNATLAIGQIAGKAVVSQEELRGQLSEALPGALQVASRAFGVTTAELNKLVEAGLTADEFLPRFARQLRRETAFAAEQGSKTLGAAVQNLANARDTLFVAIGQQASPALIGLYDGLAVALNSVAGAIAPVVAGFVDLAKIGAGIAVIQGLSLGLTALTPALAFASLALKALILDLQALTFQSFSAGIASATAGIINLVKTAATSKIAIQGLSLGITALAGSILIGVVEAGLAVDDLNKKTQESADTITKFRDDLNRANAKPIELGVADNLEQEFRDSQSVFIKLANLISVFQRLATGGDVIDNLNAVRSQKFFNTIEQGNAVLESSIKLRADDARGIIVQAKAVELAGDQLARQLSIAKDSLAVTDAERQAKDNLVKQLEREIEANRRLEDSLAGIDKAYGDVLRAVNKRIEGSKRAEAESLAEIARLEVEGTELQESLEKRKAEATKKRISEELQAQQDLLKSLQSRQDATTSTKTIDEIEKVNKKITDLTKEQANSEIEAEKAKQAEKIAIIEEASQKALSASKEAEQERLIELQKLYNADLISKEDLELEKLKVTQKATDAQLAAVEEEIKAVNSADISQRQKELKLRELREKSSDLVLQALQKQKEVEESLFNIAKAQIERLAKVQTDRIELFNEELDLKAKVIDSDKKAQLESEKLTNLLIIQEKSLERQLNIVGKRNELLKARSDASLFVSIAETDRLNRALEIVRKINSGDIGSQKELKALKQELSDLGISGTVREKELIEQIGKQEAKTRELKLKALETEQRIQSQILELEIQKTEQAQKRALIEAQSQVRTAQVEFAKAPIEQARIDLAAQKAVIESTKELAIAQKELSQASGDSEKKQAQEAIALAQRRLEIAQQELVISRDTTSTDLAKERLELAVENLREQEKISQDQGLINEYQRESLKLTQAQAKAQLEIENRTNRAANRTNRAIGEASRSQGFVSDPVVERRRRDEIDAIKAKAKLERESNADTQKAIAEARNRFNQEDIENREKAIKAQGAITVPVNLEPLPLTDLKRQVENSPPLDIPARLKIDNNGNLLDSQALNVPTIPQPQALGNRGQNGLNQLGLDILAQLKDLGLKIPNVRSEVNATFNNQFASTDQKELLRKARNQNLADIESVFANVVGAF